MKSDVRVGDIVQINEHLENKAFSYCLVTVTEVRSWGIQGFVQALGDRYNIGGQAYVRLEWDEFDLTQGRAQWIPGKQEEGYVCVS